MAMRRGREGLVAFLLWAVACVWTIVACWRLAYSGGPVETVGGIPEWILYGVFLPWVTMFVFHSAFSWFVLGRGGD